MSEKEVEVKFPVNEDKKVRPVGEKKPQQSEKKEKKKEQGA